MRLIQPTRVAVALAVLAAASGCGRGTPETASAEPASPAQDSEGDAVAPAVESYEIGGRSADELVELWVGDTRGPSPDLVEWIPEATNGCSRPGMSQAELGWCKSAMLAVAEEEMAAAEVEYRDHVEEVGPMAPYDAREEWHRVSEAEGAAWRRYRDARCTLVAFDYAGGSGAGMGVTDCLIDHTEQRTRRLLGQPERDASGGDGLSSTLTP